MRWDAKPKSPWKKRWAWYPMKFGERWIWWEPYYAQFCGLFTAVILPEELPKDEAA